MSDVRHSSPGCLDSETLAAFLDGRLESREREAVEAHLADCEDCYEVWMEGVGHSGAVDSTVPVGRSPRRRWLYIASSVAAAVALITVAPNWFAQLRIENGVTALANADRVTRFAEGRLSIDITWAPASPVVRSESMPAAGFGALAAAASLVELTEEARTPDALHARGLALLATQDVNGSIEALRRALAALPPNHSDIRNDLANALLVRFARVGQTSDADEASELAREAARLDPASLSAQFTLASSLEASAPDKAADEWRRYIALDRDPTSPWLSEAQRRLLRSPQ